MRPVCVAENVLLEVYSQCFGGGVTGLGSEETCTSGHGHDARAPHLEDAVGFHDIQQGVDSIIRKPAAYGTLQRGGKYLAGPTGRPYRDASSHSRPYRDASSHSTIEG